MDLPLSLKLNKTPEVQYLSEIKFKIFNFVILILRNHNLTSKIFKN